MRVTFLGTGTSQGVPVIACSCSSCRSSDPKDKRLRSSVIIEDRGRVYVIDAGPDFRQQMLREDVQNLDAILITHEHKDHIGGMDDVRAFNFKNRKSMDVYCDCRVESAIKLAYPYVFDSKGYPGAPRMDIHIIGDHSFDLYGREIIPVRVLHKDLPVYGFRIGGFTYITDANKISSGSMALIKGTDYLVINALRKQKHPSHFSLDQALEIIADIKPHKAYITHIGHDMGPYSEVSTELPENVELAYDGLSFTV